jgi:WhiB family redox-sensing transcriptional regulator
MNRDSLPELRQLAEPAPAWFTDALCHNTNPDLFFPDDFESPLPAITLCQACPSRQPCLRFALDTHQRGIWGGTTEKDRVAIRSGRTPAQRATTVIVHGTNAGYMKHRRWEDTTCDECLQAHNTATRQKPTG